MMMLKMMNPMGSMPSVPGVGGDKEEDSGLTREEQQEQEKLRQESLKQVERERRMKYKKQDDEREVIRSSIRDKYQLEKPANDEDCEDEDEDDEGFGGGAKKGEEVEEDPLEEARRLAEKKFADAKAVIAAQEKCSLQ
eukprot:TRINITY_DN10737_c0_g2_i2.p2 TRINITY_DN10737_c0_g2~~TRINITY_DN10737_c0_g2_i2.p2  ORF type:complete len:138 (+),score=78.67 TRINITY_DN10737_c0_g2_i2:57-470(+)